MALTTPTSSARRERTRAACRASTLVRVRRRPLSAGPPLQERTLRGALGRLLPGRNGHRPRAGPFIDGRPYLDSQPGHRPKSETSDCALSPSTGSGQRLSKGCASTGSARIAARVGRLQIDLAGVDGVGTNHAVQEQHAVTVVDLMLQRASLESIGADQHPLAAQGK
jgi:hypothetical protein